MPSDATDWNLHSYDRDVIASVWSLAQEIPGNDPAVWRKDEHGAWIHRQEYGSRHSEFGWEIHDPAISLDTSTILTLRPFQWQNYLDRLASITQSRITADGLRNSRRLLRLE